MEKKKIAGILGCTCIIVSFLIAVQLRTIQSVSKTTDVGIESGLKDEVLMLRDRYQNIYTELEKQEVQLEENRKKASQNDESSQGKEQALKLNNTILGLTTVTGKGLVVTLADNPNVTKDSISEEDKIEYYLLHNDDLLIIINELKNAGAEAISVNDKRIIPTSTIICVGNVVEVNGEKVGSPYVIKAIGNSDMLYGALSRPGGFVEILKSLGIIVDLKKSNNIEVEKYNGLLTYKIMQSR